MTVQYKTYSMDEEYTPHNGAEVNCTLITVIHVINFSTVLDSRIKGARPISGRRQRIYIEKPTADFEASINT